MEKLRAERRAREKKERERANRLLKGEDPDRIPDKKPEEKKKHKQKYSSQFNPEAARQNKLDASKKYWLE